MRTIALTITIAFLIVAVMIFAAALVVAWIYNVTDLPEFFGTGEMTSLQGLGVVLLTAIIGFGGSARNNATVERVA
jgi:predicted Kef-type K+ transport protein